LLYCVKERYVGKARKLLKSSKGLKQVCILLHCGVKNEGLRSLLVKTKPLIPLRPVQKTLWNF